MLELPGYKGLQKILWKQISPGMIVISGIKLNETVPAELQNFPVLTVGLIFDLTRKYHLREGREVIVANIEKGFPPEKLGQSLRTIDKRIRHFNDFRTYLHNKKVEFVLQYPQIQGLNHKILDSDFVLKTESVLNQFNTFSVRIKGVKPPSIFNRWEEPVQIADIFSQKIQGFKFPDDRNLVLHFVIDYSKYMFESKLLTKTITAFETFRKFIEDCNQNIQLKVYGFSDECTPLKLPISHRDMERKGRNFSSFCKKVLHFKKNDTANMVFLICAGIPDDFVDSIENGGKIRRNLLDFNMIFISEKPLPSSLEKIKAFSMTCNGNQVVILNPEFLEFGIMELMDTYMGNMSLAKMKVSEPVFANFSGKSINSKEVIKEKVVKPFVFKKINKGENQS